MTRTGGQWTKYVIVCLIVFFVALIFWLPASEPMHVVPPEKESVFPPDPNRSKSLLPRDPLLEVNLVWDFVVENWVAAKTEDDKTIFVLLFEAKAKAGSDSYDYLLVAHQGKFVELWIFRNGVPYRAWSDKGYAGNPDTGKFPPNPVYAGEWARIK